MIKTIPADYLGKKALGYVLLALVSEKSRKQIVDLLDLINAELPGVIWPMPPEQLHITLCEIIQPKDYSQDKEKLFKLHQEQYEDIPSRILSNLPKFTATFDTIEASQQAIIVRASDSSQFNAIRAELVASMQLPDETRTPPDITHSSIARYIKEVDLQKVQEVVARHRIRITEEVSEFKLLRNEQPPLQSYTVLKTYPLQG